MLFSTTKPPTLSRSVPPPFLVIYFSNCWTYWCHSSRLMFPPSPEPLVFFPATFPPWRSWSPALSPSTRRKEPSRSSSSPPAPSPLTRMPQSRSWPRRFTLWRTSTWPLPGILWRKLRLKWALLVMRFVIVRNLSWGIYSRSLDIWLKSQFPITP